MIKRVLIGSLIAVTLLGAGIAIGASADGHSWRGQETVVVRDGGTGAGNAGQTVVVSDGHYHGFFFFPFGLLFFVLVLFLVFSFFRRARGGPWRYGGRGPAWFDDWHRQAHEREGNDPGNTASA